MFNKTNTIQVSNTEDGAPKEGVFNRFVAPVSGVENKPKKDFVRYFLIIILIIVSVLAVIAFIYAGLLKRQVETKKEQLNFFDTTPQLGQLETNLPEMRNLSQRLKLVNSVYDSKIFVSSMLFPLLESLTESWVDSYVYFNNFGFRKSTENNTGIVTLSGVAINYPSIYRQMNNFRNNSNIHNLRMSNMTLDEFGNVIFSVTFDTDVSTAAYIKYINNSLMTNNTENLPDSTGPLFQREVNNTATTTTLVATTTQSVELDTDNTETNPNVATSTNN